MKAQNALLAITAVVVVIATVKLFSKRVSTVSKTQDEAKKDLKTEDASKSKPSSTTPESRTKVGDKNTEETKKADLSQEESNLGTKAFKSGSFASAIEHFSRAIELCPKEDLGSRKVLLNNRAASYEKLGDWSQVEVDATEALNLDPSYRRAILRRAKARENLGKLQLALEDLALWKSLDSASISEEEKAQITSSMDRIAQTLAKSEAEALWKTREVESKKPLEFPKPGTCRQYYYAFSMDARNMRAPPSLMAVKDMAEHLNPSASDYGDGLMQIAMMHKYRLEMKEAFELWEQVCASKTASKASVARANTEIASLYHLSGDRMTARTYLNRAQQIFESSQAWIKLAALAVEDGDFALGRQYLENGFKCVSGVGVDAKTDRADLNFHLSAISCLEATDLTPARQLLESAIADVPDYGLAYMQLGVVLFRMGLGEESLGALEQACLLVPEVAEVHNFHGEVLMSMKRREEALKSFKEASHADEFCSLPLLNQGVMCMTSDSSEEPNDDDLHHALELFNKAVEVDPTNEIAYIHRASYYCHIGDLRTALLNYDEAIRLTKSLPYLIEYLSFRHLCAADLAVQGRLEVH